MTLTENRNNGTWRSQPNQHTYLRPGPFAGSVRDESFDRELPAEELEEIQRPAKPRVRIRAVGRKLEGLPPPQNYRVREISPYHPVQEPSPVFLRPPPPTRTSSRTVELPAQIPQPAVFLRPPPLGSAPRPSVTLPPPPVSPPSPPVISGPARPAQRAPRGGSGIWWILASLLVVPVLLGLLPQAVSTGLLGTEPQPTPWVEVRRALPTAPRAVPLASAASTVPNGGWQSIRMPTGEIVPVHYEGELASSAALPSQGTYIGQEFSTGKMSWIWMTRAGASFPSWVDP
jgi:hypothetical protein